MLYYFVVFESYQRARHCFVQSIADLAMRHENIEVLQNAGVIKLLRPLLLDTVPSVQQGAALAIGRLADYNVCIATEVVNSDIIPQLIYCLGQQNVSMSDA